MSYIIVCQCSQQMTVQDDQAGLEAVCINCRRHIQVPPKPVGSQPAPAIMMGGPTPGPVPGPTSGLPPFGAIPPSQGGWLKPHRGGTILTLGILSIFLGCCCAGLWAGLPAVIMGSNDLKEMNTGRMDPGGRGMTQAGLILGAIGLVLMVAGPILQFFAFPFAGMPRHYQDLFPNPLNS